MQHFCCLVATWRKTRSYAIMMDAKYELDRFIETEYEPGLEAISCWSVSTGALVRVAFEARLVLTNKRDDYMETLRMAQTFAMFNHRFKALLAFLLKKPAPARVDELNLHGMKVLTYLVKHASYPPPYHATDGRSDDARLSPGGAPLHQ